MTLQQKRLWGGQRARKEDTAWDRPLVLQGKQTLKSSEPLHFHHCAPISPGLLLGSRAIFLLPKVSDLSRLMASPNSAERQTLVTHIPASPGSRRQEISWRPIHHLLTAGAWKRKRLVRTPNQCPSAIAVDNRLAAVFPLTGGTGGQAEDALEGKGGRLVPSCLTGLELSWLFV